MTSGIPAEAREAHERAKKASGVGQYGNCGFGGKVKCPDMTHTVAAAASDPKGAARLDAQGRANAGADIFDGEGVEVAWPPENDTRPDYTTSESPET